MERGTMEIPRFEGNTLSAGQDERNEEMRRLGG